MCIKIKVGSKMLSSTKMKKNMQRERMLYKGFSEPWKCLQTRVINKPATSIHLFLHLPRLHARTFYDPNSNSGWVKAPAINQLGIYESPSIKLTKVTFFHKMSWNDHFFRLPETHLLIKIFWIKVASVPYKMSCKDEIRFKTTNVFRFLSIKVTNVRFDQ